MKRAFNRVFSLINEISAYFKRGFKQGLLKKYTRVFIDLTILHVNNLRANLSDLSKDKEALLDKLEKTTKGLYSLLPKDSQKSYSILISAQNVSSEHLFHSLLSACRQAPRTMEVLLAVNESTLYHEVLDKIDKLNPGKVKVVSTHGHFHESINILANQAKADFLLIMKAGDILRPDLLYRYELALRTANQPDHTVIYADMAQITERGAVVPKGEIRRGEPRFPYYFCKDFPVEGMLVPKKVWKEVQGFSHDINGGGSLDFALKLQLAGTVFCNIPLPLYSLRTHLPTSSKAALKALERYTTALGLNWLWDLGFTENALRAIPKLKATHSIQVIIPYKEQKALTLSCIKHLLAQQEVDIVVTAIDNNSEDLSIGEELLRLGVEVISVHEPFNYSRLNNLAVALTTKTKQCDLLLFLNNDVDLEPGALLEMVRWIEQPDIGIVGCRLNYPNGKLQHGGVELDTHKVPGVMTWIHREKLKLFHDMDKSKQLGIVDAVTAACALMRKEDFLAVAGFDEVFYPIAYSDTNLCAKLSKMGLASFYTPFACGIHHESVSRKEGIEDFENSLWLHQRTY